MGAFEIFFASIVIDILPDEFVRNILVNVPHEGKDERSIVMTKRMFIIANTIHTYLDSGGFQLLLAEIYSKLINFDCKRPPCFTDKEVNIAPEHIIDVAMKMQPTIISALDFPIRTVTNEAEQEAEFMKKLGYNVLFTQRTAKLRKEICPEIQFFVPVQAYTVSQFEEFIWLIRDVEFDGLSIPIRNMEIPELAIFLTSFYQKRISKVHILGTSKFMETALGAYMARHLFDWVSMDSTSWRITAEHSIYLSPYDFSPVSVAYDVLIDENIIMDCKCPWCQGKTFTYLKNLLYTNKVSFLRCHNHWVISNTARELYENADTVSSLRHHLLSRTGKTEEVEELCNCLTVVEALKDGNIQALQNLLN